MTRMKARRMVGGWFLFLLLPAMLAAKTVEESLAELERLPAPQRQRLLVERARSEGRIGWYGNYNLDQATTLKDAFEKKYPPIQIDYWRGSGNKVVDRILNETRAGRWDVDVIFAGDVGTYILMQAGVVGRYRSPERMGYSARSVDKEGYWSGLTFGPSILAYNTKLVKEAEVPKSYEDFLHPRWRGEMAIDMEADRVVSAWLILWGEQKTVEYLKALMANKPIVRKGHTLLTQLLCGGEFKVAPELYAYQVTRMKREKGCSIDFRYPDPTPASITPVAVAKNPPHPFAAALFVDFLLSAEGQNIFAAVGRIPARRGIKAQYPDISNIEERGIKLLLMTPEEEGKWQEKSFKLVEEYIVRKRATE